jgi:hypothetical protein
MDYQRKDDVTPFTTYRASRFFKNGEQWYFHSREGGDQGPFDNRMEAQYALTTYTRVFKDLEFQSQIPAPDYCASVNKLSLVPIEMQWR